MEYIERDFISRRAPGELYFSRRENTRERLLRPLFPPRGRYGQSRRKIERIQFLSWFADFITPLHTVSYIRSRAPRTFAAALPWSEGLLFSGGFERGVSPNERHVRVRRMSHGNRGVGLRNAFSKWTEREGYSSKSERKTMVGPSDVPQGSFLERDSRWRKKRRVKTFR